MNFHRLIPFFFLITAPLQAADFALRDGDTLTFLGDSITAARGYTKIVEHYTIMRFPDRQVRFINAGQGGDTANGSLHRLDRDVFSKGTTVLTVAFGINDIVSRSPDSTRACMNCAPKDDCSENTVRNGWRAAKTLPPPPPTAGNQAGHGMRSPTP